MARRVTLRDVADRAQVSVTTVSNVVRGWPYIAADTRSRVEVAIQELGYSPHSIAQGLRTGRTQAIGLIVPDLASLYFAVSYGGDGRDRGPAARLQRFRHQQPQLAGIGGQAIDQVASRWVDGLLIVQSTRSADTSSQLRRLQISGRRYGARPDGLFRPLLHD